jgi:hypothetical protein
MSAPRVAAGKHPIRIVSVVAAAAIVASCSNMGEPSPGGGLVADPAAGLAQLTHYRAALTREADVKTAEGSIKRSDRLSLEVWTAHKAVFQTIESQDPTGENLSLTVGTVDRAGYLVTGEEGGCRVFWDEGNIDIDLQSLTGYLYPLKSGTPSGEEKLNGVSARTYNLDADSIGVKDVQATGKVWIAADGGYVLKYHLQLSGGEALFGPVGTGTQTIDYELSGVNTAAAVSYPGDCRAVQTDIPTTDNAQSVARMPDGLRYRSTSSQAQVGALYEKYFEGLGWHVVSKFDEAEGQMDILFSDNSNHNEALVSLRTEGKLTSVSVMTTDGPKTQPIPSGGPTLPASARIVVSLSKLLGSEGTPSVLPSYVLVAEQTMPSSAGAVVTRMRAEVEGQNIHYVRTSGGKTSEAYLVDGKEYGVAGGKATPGSAMAKVTWLFWQLDILPVLSSAALSDPQTGPTTSLEGRAVDVFSISGSDLGGSGTGSGSGVLPVTVTSIEGTIWVDHETDALLKADLLLEADVKKPSASPSTTHGKGELHITVGRIGRTTVRLPN